MRTKHSNRQAYNWLIYKKIDDFFFNNTTLFNGVLYDFGCGDKPYESFLKKYVSNYIGLDWGNSLYNSKADILVDLNKKLPIESEVADCILSVSVIEHLANPNMMLEEAYRTLKKGGRIVLQVPFQWKIHEAPYDYQRFTSYGLKNIFENAGFKSIKIYPTCGLFSTVALKINYFSKKAIKGPTLIKWIVKLILTPFWYLNQVLGLFFDKFDKNWAEETQSFWVVASK